MKRVALVLLLLGRAAADDCTYVRGGTFPGSWPKRNTAAVSDPHRRLTADEANCLKTWIDGFMADLAGTDARLTAGVTSASGVNLQPQITSQGDTLNTLTTVTVPDLADRVARLEAAASQYPQTVIAPTINPGSGTYTAAQTVALATATTGSTICYTTDGSTPDVSAANPPVCTAGAAYSAPLVVSTTTTIKAIAGKYQLTKSAVTSATLSIVSVGGGGGTLPAGSPSFMMATVQYESASFAQTRYDRGILDTVEFNPAFDTAKQAFFTTAPTRPALFMSMPTVLGTTITNAYPSSADDTAPTILVAMSSQVPVYRHSYPEFDSGGVWATGRPSYATSDAATYTSMLNFWNSTLHMSTELGNAARGYKVITTSSFAQTIQFAADMGADMFCVEKIEDEMSGMQPGIAMVRGAASQRTGREWCYDNSTWKYWTNTPTQYTAGAMTGGWSTATFKRHLYQQWASGTNLILNEPANYEVGAAAGHTLNPLGETIQAFHTFEVAHPARGTPWVPFAIVKEHKSAWEPPFGEWFQSGLKWFGTGSYTDGDRYLEALVWIVWPNYKTWGTIPPSATWADPYRSGARISGSNISATQSAYRAQIAAGADVRPWEPMGASRYGETFDIITDATTLGAMQKYKVIIWTPAATLTADQVTALNSFANAGGTVVIKTAHLSSPTTDALSSGASASGYTGITTKVIGSGRVYIDSAAITSTANTQALLDALHTSVTGTPVVTVTPSVASNWTDWLVTTDGDRIILTITNTAQSGGSPSSAAWGGTVSFLKPATTCVLRDWTNAGATVTSTDDGTRVSATMSVPAYDVVVYALDCRSESVVHPLSVAVSPTSATVNGGATQNYTATVLPADSTVMAVNWSVVGTNCGTMSQASTPGDGSTVSVYTAGPYGSTGCKVRATTQDGGIVAESTITIADPGGSALQIDVAATPTQTNFSDYSTRTISITTSGAALIVVGTQARYGTPQYALSGVSGSTLGAFTKVDFTGIGDGGCNYSTTREITWWYKVASGAVTGETITATWGGTANMATQLVAYALTGYNATPIGAKATASVTPGTMQVPITPQAPNSILLAAFADWGQDVTAPTSITGGDGVGSTLLSYYPAGTYEHLSVFRLTGKTANTNEINVGSSDSRNAWRGCAIEVKAP